ncbi:MAG: elongation factor G [Acidobacteria bacterium]|nr:elongation factor G [Acidobacteriota bacterium]
MKVYDTAHLRNVAFVGHGNAGKTSLVSGLLYATGVTHHLGSVIEGNTLTDFDQDEIERKVSMSVAAAFAEWHEVKLNLVDAPGLTNYIGEAAAAMRAADLTLIVVHANDGIAVQTEKMWEDAAREQLPVAFAVNHLDRERADFEQVVAALVERFGRKVIPASLPLGQESGIAGAVCLVTGKAYRSKPGSAAAEIGDPPADMADAVAAAREKLIEAVAESDDELMNLFLEEGALSDERFVSGLRKAIATRAIHPVFATAGTLMAGVHPLLDALVAVGPSPADRPALKVKLGDGEKDITADPSGPIVAQVFKTYIDPFAGRISLLRMFSGTLTLDQPVWNASRENGEKASGLAFPRGKNGERATEVRAGDIAMLTKLKDTHTGDTLVPDKGHELKVAPIPFPRPVIAYAVHGEGKGDDEKIAAALQRLAEEDPTLKLDRDQRSHELMLSGLGIDHVKVAIDKVAKRFNVKATLEKPKIPYLETITKAASTMYRHKKQTGGAGQFAEVHMRVEPLPRGTGFEYASEVFGGSISRNFWPSIEKGVRHILEQGVVAGYPMVDVRAVIFDGKEHPVDSKDIAFQIAGREVFKRAAAEAGAVVLEPIMKVVVTCPDDCMGDILGDLTRRRGKVQGSEGAAGRTTVRALVPMAEMLEYSATLKSLTSDRGSYTMELDHYEKVPTDIQQKLQAEFKPQASED